MNPNRARDLLNYMEDAVEKFVTQGKVTTDVEFKKVVAQLGCRKPEITVVAAKFTRTATEVMQALDKSCPQMVEGYSNFTRSNLKKYLSIISLPILAA